MYLVIFFLSVHPIHAAKRRQININITYTTLVFFLFKQEEQQHRFLYIHFLQQYRSQARKPRGKFCLKIA